MEFPSLYRVKQKFDVDSIKDVPAVVRERFAEFKPGDKVSPGQSVAVAVASRGTHDLKDLVITTIKCLEEMGLKPFVIPAMGSHGGATGPGQAQVLADLGISEATTGVPVRATMDVVSFGRIESGAEVFCAQDALEADHVVVINRVKPHTSFRSHIESGLCKIMAVGLGRQIGASNIHKYALANTIVPAARRIQERLPILCGLAVTENALGGTQSIRLARPEEFETVDREMLEEAWGLLPLLPVDQLDVLIIDEMGKDVSGAGMDPNVIGVWRREGGERKPDYFQIIILDLTAASHGNATGIGMADLTTKRFMDMVDLEATYMNCMTSGVFRSARIPLTVENDRRAVEAALNALPDPAAARVGRIVNTCQLETFWVSQAVTEELRAKPGITVEDSPHSPGV